MPLLSLAMLAGLTATAQTASDFYSESEIQDIHLQVHPDDWAALKQNYLENTYYQAQFRWRDITLPSVGIRSRGSGSAPSSFSDLLGDASLLNSSVAASFAIASRLRTIPDSRLLVSRSRKAGASDKSLLTGIG